ncbi:Molybdopterin-guanine dinucleotide biosynthesis protein A [Caldalkalibacillus thermarum TA2.A1]|uniref:Probable molybdenum cofactor guanylyltransferase n=1 Tax=Caldalkalibacillus thermarum (strain TA2.A1) TaxID=986075 RepID=F5L7E6_CALTT|nr:molybdenum cofactor guanylyltransferase [Caldalkalibacillus thermarum]EGL82738.1 Molybdopterin-guanine dinucleotide biosynthesis protein A [Caldalkalibacillus thermarum TA2.A1]QZT32564.1 molybdenum cofactor guanylyltransferase [Caldalkalibacillus thermarum TA2.A1]
MWTSIILAGGASRRMGQPKALLSIENKTMVERLVDLLRPFSSVVVIVVREQEQETISALLQQETAVHIVTDDPRYKGEGPLAGMYTGMKTAPAQSYFVCACDMPCLDGDYLQGLKQFIQDKPGYEAYVPLAGGQYQPFAAVYGELAAEIEGLLQRSRKRWIDLFSVLKNGYLIPEEEWRSWTKQPDPFFNMNTPEDYKRMRSGWV